MPCTGGNGLSHTARELLRIAELEAVTPADKAHHRPRWYEPADETPDAQRERALASARHALAQCGRGSQTLYTTSSTLAEKLRTMTDYPIVDLSKDTNPLRQG